MQRLLLSLCALVALVASCASDGAATVDTPALGTASPESSLPSAPTTQPNSQEPASTEAPAESEAEPWVLLDADKRAQVPDTASGYVVTYYGDSLASSAQEWVGTYLELGGRIAFRPKSFPGSAICDWTNTFETDIGQYDVWATILLFSNNTFTDCMKDDNGEPLAPKASIRKFRNDLAAAIELFGDEGATVYLPTIPESRGDVVDELDTSIVLNEVFADFAQKYAHVQLVDAAVAVLGPDGRYTETLPCLPTEPCTGGVDENGVGVNLVREWDGVHFCTGGYGPDLAPDVGNCPSWSSGAYRYAGALTAPIVEAAQREWITNNPSSKELEPIVRDRPAN